MTHLTDDSVLPLQEVMVRGTYHLDSRGAEHRWLPPTLQNCENLPPQHQYLSSIQQYLFYVTLVLPLSCPGFISVLFFSPEHLVYVFFLLLAWTYSVEGPPPLLLLLASLLRKSSGNQLFVDTKSDFILLHFVKLKIRKSTSRIWDRNLNLTDSISGNKNGPINTRGSETEDRGAVFTLLIAHEMLFYL